MRGTNAATNIWRWTRSMALGFAAAVNFIVYVELVQHWSGVSH